MNEQATKKIEECIALANRLCNSFEERNSLWEENVDKLFKLEIVLNQLQKKNLISPKEARLVRLRMKPLSDWTTLNSPHIKNNEKIKLMVQASLLKEFE